MANLTRRPMWDLRRGIDQLFDDFFSGFPGTAQATELETFRPTVELSEGEHEYRVNVELPGLKPEEVEVSVDEGMLKIRGEKKREEHKMRQGVEYSERTYGSFTRSIQLPRTVDASKINAQFENGVLAITIPKTEAAKPRRIPLTHSQPSRQMGAPEAGERPQSGSAQRAVPVAGGGNGGKGEQPRK